MLLLFLFTIHCINSFDQHVVTTDVLVLFCNLYMLSVYQTVHIYVIIIYSRMHACHLYITVCGYLFLHIIIMIDMHTHTHTHTLQLHACTVVS